MRTALLTLLIPCVAFGRVGEKYRDFIARINSPPSRENTHRNGLIEASYRVNDITVMVRVVNGTISTEVYAPVDEAQARALASKVFGRLEPSKIKNGLVWDLPGKLSGVYNDGVLAIKDGRDEKLVEEIEKEKEEKRLKGMNPF